MESGRNARRRLSAASTTNDEHEASIRLLIHGRGHDETPEEPHIRLRLKNDTDKSKWLRPFGLLFLVLVLTTITITSFQTLSKMSTSSKTSGQVYNIHDESGDDEQLLGIKLHPEDHVSRSAKTLTFHWDITSDYRAPDGVKKEVYLVNGQFPGPTIECRSGDRLIIHVTNSLSSEEGVSIHWHGLHMRNANSMDGAVGFTQCPIANGTTFTYKFDVDKEQAGTFWWHAHSQVQRGDGMYGGLVIHEPFNVNIESRRDDAYGSEVLLMIGDWYHRSSDEVLSWYMSTRGFGNEPVPDSMLINGIGRFICSMAVPARPVECVDILESGTLPVLGHDNSEKKTRLRIVNVGSLAGFTFRLSSGTFTPLTVDGNFPVAGKDSNSVGIIYPGERVDLLLHSDTLRGANSPRLNISLDPENFKYPNSALRPNQTFDLFSNVQGAVDGAQMPEGSHLKHFDLASATAPPSYEMTFQPSELIQQSILLYTKTQKLAKLSNRPTGFINRTSWSPQRTPPFPLRALARTQWDSNQLVSWVLSSSAFVDVIVNNLDDGAHPFHLHGNDFYVLASYRSEHGWGSYSPFESSGPSSLTPKLNLVNPLRKDTVSVPRRGHVILRFQADNPGIWMFHCHVLFHQASGMAMGIQVGGEEGHEDFDVDAKSLCG